MLSRDERKKQLETLMRTYRGQDEIMDIYRKKVSRIENEEIPRMDWSEMIARILAKEYREAASA